LIYFPILQPIINTKPTHLLDVLHAVTSEITGRCPPIGSTGVTVIGSGPSIVISGHASFDPKISGLMRQSFSMLLAIAAPPRKGGQRTYNKLLF